MDVNDSIAANSDRVIQAEKESPKLEPTVQPRTVANDDIPKLRDKPVDHQRGSQTGSDRNYSSEEDANLCGRPVTDSVTAQAGSYTDFPNGEHYEFVDRRVTEAVTSRTGSDKDISGDVVSKLFGRPVTDSVTAQDGSYTDFPNGEHYELVDRRVTEAVTSRTGSDKDISGDVGSKLFSRPVTDSVTARAGSYTDFPNGEHYEFVDRRVTEAVTSRTGSDKDISGDGGSKLFDGPVTESAMAWAERDSHGPSDEYGKNYTDFPNGEHYEFVDRRVTEAVTSRTGSDKDISGDEDSICDTSDDEFLTDEEWPISEHMVQPRMVADNVNRTVRHRNNNRGCWSWPGSENDITSDENYNLVDRPVTELATAGADIENESFSVEHVKCGEIPETELIPVRVLDTEEPLIMRVSTRALSDFSDDIEETGVEQLSGCRIPGCKCDGRVVVMKWGPDGMPVMDDSEYESSFDRAYRLYGDSYNYDLPEGMTPKTYNPPP